MSIEPNGETRRVTLILSPTLWEQLRAYAERHTLPEATAARMLLAAQLRLIEGPPDPEAQGWEPQP